MDTFILTVTNSVPTISNVMDQTITANTSSSAFAFTIGDLETAADSLVLSASSSNTSLLTNSNIVFAGSGSNRTVMLSPALHQTGVTIVSLTVSDGVLSASDSFVLTVELDAGTTTRSFSPTDDALVRSDRPTSNYGVLNYLRLRGTEAYYISYIKFNVTGLSGRVMSARLRFFAYDATSNPISVYAVSNNYLGTDTSWTEAGLTWNNAPTMSGSPIISGQTTIASNSWLDYDLSGTNRLNNKVFWIYKGCAVSRLIVPFPKFR
jgi:hypothetical protein